MTLRKEINAGLLGIFMLMAAPLAAQEGGSARTITLNMKKGDIGDALRLVAEQGGLNLVVGPDVKGDVSVFLTDASLETALKSITVNNGFEFRVENGVISVSKPPEKASGPEVAPPMVTRVFNLRSQDAERAKDALEFALTKWGKMKVLNQNSETGYGVQRLNSLSGDLSQGGSNGSATVASTSSGTQNGQQQLQGQTMGPGGGAGGQGASGLGYPHGARTLVVTDVKESVERIAELIEDLDRLPPQVLIEARIVEMSTDLQRQLGIDWNMNVLANGPILNHGWPLRNRAGFASGSQIQRDWNGAAVQTAGLALGSIDFSQFQAIARANQSDTSIRLLANPRLLVYNNHSASILVGERYPILQATITNFGTVTEAFQTYIPVGVQLEVTPTIMVDGTVSMLVHPTTSNLGDDVIGTTGLRVARIRTRELDTRIIMRDGDTVVLGGLISDRKTHQANKVPGLGDVPVLDIFFRQENPRAERVDLLVFLTAHVEGATEISERDQHVFDMYKPHFKHVERLQDVPLHFEIPTEYEPPKPMFSDPPKECEPEASDESETESVTESKVETKSETTIQETTPETPVETQEEPKSQTPDSSGDEPAEDKQTRMMEEEPPAKDPFAPVMKNVAVPTSQPADETSDEDEDESAEKLEETPNVFMAWGDLQQVIAGYFHPSCDLRAEFERRQAEATQFEWLQLPARANARVDLDDVP